MTETSSLDPVPLETLAQLYQYHAAQSSTTSRDTAAALSELMLLRAQASEGVDDTTRALLAYEDVLDALAPKEGLDLQEIVFVPREYQDVAIPFYGDGPVLVSPYYVTDDKCGLYVYQYERDLRLGNGVDNVVKRYLETSHTTFRFEDCTVKLASVAGGSNEHGFLGACSLLVTHRDGTEEILRFVKVPA